jgi:hypothetical protein
LSTHPGLADIHFIGQLVDAIHGVISDPDLKSVSSRSPVAKGPQEQRFSDGGR